MKNNEDLNNGIKYKIRVSPESIVAILKSSIRVTEEGSENIIMTGECWREFLAHALSKICETCLDGLKDDEFFEIILNSLSSNNSPETDNSNLPLLEMPSPSLYKN